MNHIKSVLHNLSTSENINQPNIIPYCQGIVIGVVSTIMQDRNLLYTEAIFALDNLWPEDLDPTRLPNKWRDHILLSIARREYHGY